MFDLVQSSYFKFLGHTSVCSLSICLHLLLSETRKIVVAPLPKLIHFIHLKWQNNLCRNRPRRSLHYFSNIVPSNHNKRTRHIFKCSLSPFVTRFSEVCSSPKSKVLGGTEIQTHSKSRSWSSCWVWQGTWGQTTWHLHFSWQSYICIPSDEVQNIRNLCDVVIQPSLVTSLNCIESGHLEWFIHSQSEAIDIRWFGQLKRNIGVLFKVKYSVEDQFYKISICILQKCT